VLRARSRPAEPVLPGRAARAELERRRVALARRAGPVVDLADLVGSELVGALAPGTTVVGVLALAGSDDPAALLDRVVAVLPPDGRVALLEPLRRAGAAGRLQALTAPGVRLAAGLHPDHPVPSLVRAAGLVIASIERFTMPTPVVPLRPFVQLEAIPAPSAVAR